MVLGHTISVDPGVIGCLGSLIFIHPHPGDPAGGLQSPPCVQVACCSTDPSFRSTATARPVPAASKMFLVALSSCRPLMPRSLSDCRSEEPATPLHPTSTGSQQASQLLFWNCVLSSAYLALLNVKVSTGDREFQGSWLLGGF